MSRVDGFIDDLINVFADTPENCRMQPHVVPLAMHVTSRPPRRGQVGTDTAAPTPTVPTKTSGRKKPSRSPDRAGLED